MTAIEKGGGRPDEYRTKDGTRVPGATTILGRWKESGGLLYWAWNEGREGRSLNARKDQAASIGSVAHDAVEAHVHGNDGAALINASALNDEGKAAATRSYNAYLEWERAFRVVYIATEVPIVSERYRFGGTIDCFAEISGKRAILDWKTSKAVYTDMLLQLAAYALLWEEARDEIVSVGHLCRFSKKTAGFEHRYWPELGLAKEQFIALVDCYGRDKSLGDYL